MTYTDLLTRCCSLLGMSLILLNSSLLPNSHSKVEYVSYVASSPRGWVQLSEYVPPADIGMPERGEPGGTR